jgi:DNA-binding response OmpR family regulator
MTVVRRSSIELSTAKEMSEMARSVEKRHTILHFGTDRVVLVLRAWNLNAMGYRVLNVSNPSEAVELASRRRVDAVVLDLHCNHAEVVLVATQIKRCRPQVPTILIAEETAHLDGLHKLADSLVSKRDNLGMLFSALENVLATDKPDSPKVASRIIMKE